MFVYPLLARDEEYFHWWDPRWLPERFHPFMVRSLYARQPRCGCWVRRTEPVPLTARWVLLDTRYVPGWTLYCRSQAAAQSWVQRLGFEGNPAISILPLEELDAYLEEH